VETAVRAAYRPRDAAGSPLSRSVLDLLETYLAARGVGDPGRSGVGSDLGSSRVADGVPEDEGVAGAAGSNDERWRIEPECGLIIPISLVKRLELTKIIKAEPPDVGALPAIVARYLAGAYSRRR
jgi:hypothetical protein